MRVVELIALEVHPFHLRHKKYTEKNCFITDYHSIMWTTTSFHSLFSQEILIRLALIPNQVMKSELSVRGAFYGN